MSSSRGLRQQGFSRQPALAFTMFCKMIVAIVGVALMAVSTTTGTESETYLDHVHKQYEEKVIKIGQRRSPVNLKASLIPRPEGYEEPKNWTTDSALRLIYLIKENKTGSELQQTLSNLVASTIAGDGSEINLRGTEEQSVVNIENHMRANLPSAMIDLKSLIDLILPERVSSWLSSMGSPKPPRPKGRGKVGGRVFGKGSGAGKGLFGDYGGGGWGSGWSGGWGGGWGEPSVLIPVIVPKNNSYSFMDWIKDFKNELSKYTIRRPGGSHSNKGPGSYSYSYSRRSDDKPLSL